MKMILWGYSGFCSNPDSVSIAQKEDDCPFRKDPPRGGLIEWFNEFLISNTTACSSGAFQLLASVVKAVGLDLLVKIAPFDADGLSGLRDVPVEFL